MTRVTDTVEVGPDVPKVYGANFRYLAIASRPVRGVVTDKETGKPLAGVLIRVGRTHRTSPLGSRLLPTGYGMLTTRTDREGRYQVLGCPKSAGYDIFAQPAETGHHFSALPFEITDTPGLGPLTVDIKLSPGIPVRGKVLDEQTGKPIPGARVHYYPLDPNPASRAFDYAWTESSAIAGPDGSFAIVALPGPGIVGAVAPDADAYGRGRITLKELDDFSKKHKVPLSEGNTEDLMGINVGPLVVSVFNPRCFNRATLVHPDEKDKELKLDLGLRPKEGKEKSQGVPKQDKGR
jgi:hypothetical protein